MFTPSALFGKLDPRRPDGRAVIVNHANGKAGVIVGCANATGAVVIQDANGKIVDGFPKPKDSFDG